ncbi:uncharacterized protein LOC129774820 isoform X2 [Toxorhynchites rutilus septentrionalis]|uniref:uncharacterized protein LOC129774820 isoform X2 n=1 Tax=Toxorhynchites rutilus septentrionalis TaxID=329112 RepID=UPI00247A84E3|nr:uncharacterized protein LOC129774820 isoform X2 [Toxorhynchites rutilus septentrionalis]
MVGGIMFSPDRPPAKSGKLSMTSGFARAVLLPLLLIVASTRGAGSNGIEMDDLPSLSASSHLCGGTLTATHGTIQTPNFPERFPVPISCTWIIDASAVAGTNISIVVYLTQQYVLSGLRFTEYMYYSEDYKVPSMNVFELSEEGVTNVPWIKFNSPYLEIRFTMDNLYGTHLRALDRLLDVYGFNITYEVDTIKSYHCNALQCRFLGQCYAKQDYSSYYCDCYPGFSGIDCGYGPLCKDSHNCENGGTCKHIGDNAVTCLCPAGFKGNKCEISEYDEITGCNLDNGEDCFRQCIYTEDGGKDACKCDQSISSSSRGRAKYEVTVRLANSSYFETNENGDRQLNENTISLLEKHINRFLRGSNVSKINDLEVFSGKADNEVKIQFFGAKIDSSRIRESMERIVEQRGRTGNISFASFKPLFRQDAGLMLQSVVVNQKGPVRENTEFILSCVAQGSSTMSFRWYKNGFFVNVTKATRNMWTRLLPLDSKDHYTALLGITKASPLDEGIYTCQVNDMGMQQCRSTKVQILGAPQLRVDPPSVSLFRGESLLIRCLSQDSYQQYGTLGYSWTKNGALFQSDPNAELWEDLYPDGSILKVKNLQKSVVYTCIVSNSVAPISKSVHVTVVEPGSVTLCPKNNDYGVSWPASASGPAVLTDCPKRGEGLAKRICEQRDFGRPEWLTPDFSECAPDAVIEIENEFRGLTFGYQKTNGTNVLQSCLEYARKHYAGFLPGEGGVLLGLLQEIFRYVENTGTQHEQEVASDIILRVVDVIMQNKLSLNNQQQIKQLQDLVQATALNRETTMAAPISSSSSLSSSSSSSKASLAATTTVTHQLNSFYLYTESVKGLPFNLQIYGDQLYSDQLYMEMDVTSSLLDIVSNGTVLVTVISYKNLTSFLPRFYFAKNSFGTDIDYIPASKIISSWLYYANRTGYEPNRPLHVPLESAHVEIIFQHENSPTSEWIPLCGYDAKATFEPTWRTDLCITENLMENITRCICPLSGTFVVLLAKKNYNASVTKTSTRPILVVISCGCCFLQSCIAFAIMLPILYQRRCCVTFLKMQFCSATSMAMAIFILGLLQLFPQEWYNMVIALLTGFLLLSSSTLVAITVLVTTELGPRKLIAATSSLATGISASIGLSWFLPILCATSTPLVYSVMFESPAHWWHTADSFGFILFIVIESLFVILFLLLFLTLMKKLLYLAKKHDKHNTSILRRIGLLYRTAMLFVSNMLCHAFYLVYLNTEDRIGGYVFSASSIIMGFSILCSFVIKAEMKHDSGTTSSKSSTKHSLDENCCSGSINSPLSFYTTQELDKDNECLPAGGKTTKIPLTMLPSSHQQQQPQVHTQQAQQQHQNQLPSHITTVEPCIHGDGHSMETYLGGSIPTGASSICNFVAHEYECSTGAVSGSQGLCNFNAKTNCYELMGQQQQHHPSVASPLVSRGVLAENPSVIVTTAVPPPSNGVLGHFDWHQKQPQQQHQPFVDIVGCGVSVAGGGLREAFSHQPGGVNGKCYITQQHQQQPETGEFTGVGELDILKGVGQDSVIGIHSKTLRISDPSGSNKQIITLLDPSSGALSSDPPPESSCCILQQQQQHSSVEMQPSQVPSFACAAATAAAATLPTVSAPVIVEHHPYHLKPQQTTHYPAPQSADPAVAPVITVTESDDPDRIDGMMDRISHDLDYLLNRTSEVPTVVPIQLRQSGGSASCSNSSSSSSSSNIDNSRGISGSETSSTNARGGPSSDNSTTTVTAVHSAMPPCQKPPLVSSCHSVHEVIIEESEDVDS